MPGKSRHGRGRHSARSKKGKIRQDISVTRSPQPAVAQKLESVSPVATPSAKMPMPRSTLPPVQYPYIATELRRIAVLAGIMLAILAVLYLVIF